MSTKDFNLYTDKGVIIFSDGKTVAIESRQYSHKEDGDWEDGEYVPYEHILFNAIYNLIKSVKGKGFNLDRFIRLLKSM